MFHDCWDYIRDGLCHGMLPKRKGECPTEGVPVLRKWDTQQTTGTAVREVFQRKLDRWQLPLHFKRDNQNGA
ncbi:hypothetical protein NicSoilE8_41910 (plasmid) [Arthrobacter sp. NicSoilE8]|nr:hypothetical protein NicSoilE8_41910 [Arthrobacter sp. NicSoilE8]